MSVDPSPLPPPPPPFINPPVDPSPPFINPPIDPSPLPISGHKLPYSVTLNDDLIIFKADSSLPLSYSMSISTTFYQTTIRYTLKKNDSISSPVKIGQYIARLKPGLKKGTIINITFKMDEQEHITVDSMFETGEKIDENKNLISIGIEYTCLEQKYIMTIHINYILNLSKSLNR